MTVNEHLTEILKSYNAFDSALKREIGFLIQEEITKVLTTLELKRRDAFNTLPFMKFDLGRISGFNEAIFEFDKKKRLVVEKYKLLYPIEE